MKILILMFIAFLKCLGYAFRQANYPRVRCSQMSVNSDNVISLARRNIGSSYSALHAWTIKPPGSRENIVLKVIRRSNSFLRWLVSKVVSSIKSGIQSVKSWYNSRAEYEMKLQTETPPSLSLTKAPVESVAESSYVEIKVWDKTEKKIVSKMVQLPTPAKEIVAQQLTEIGMFPYKLL